MKSLDPIVTGKEEKNSFGPFTFSTQNFSIKCDNLKFPLDLELVAGFMSVENIGKEIYTGNIPLS